MSKNHNEEIQKTTAHQSKQQACVNDQKYKNLSTSRKAKCKNWRWKFKSFYKAFNGNDKANKTHLHELDKIEQQLSNKRIDKKFDDETTI